MIQAFEIQSQACLNDTTSVSVYGDADNKKAEESIRIGFSTAKSIAAI
jgi:hypothetical protein